MYNSRKMMTLMLLVVTALAVWWLVDVNSEMFEAMYQNGQEEPAIPSIVNDPEPHIENWDGDDFSAFFVEYRLQRERVRANEIEMLVEMIDNENVSAEGKKEAEEQYLALIKTMDQELIVENMLKAHGFKDAIFFYKEGNANVVVLSETINEQQFIQIAEMVNSVTGVEMENVRVIEHTER